MLGADAIGVFASDRPQGGFDSRALRPEARVLYTRLATAWRKQTGSREPTEEALAGFSAAWVLFHDVLPHAATRNGSPVVPAVVTAARSLNLPLGALVNGAGVRFATGGSRLGQNLRASAIIWQWQGVRHSVVVWPREFATGRITRVPLPR
ncbi:MAG: hypothetical protein ACR2JC_08490 [Chloroflexota bacterium]|nr:MAG: hypothetical protein DLM70_15190 [Chloroflexota bacterium]